MHFDNTMITSATLDRDLFSSYHHFSNDHCKQPRLDGVYSHPLLERNSFNKGAHLNLTGTDVGLLLSAGSKQASFVREAALR